MQLRAKGRSILADEHSLKVECPNSAKLSMAALSTSRPCLERTGRTHTVAALRTEGHLLRAYGEMILALQLSSTIPSSC